MDKRKRGHSGVTLPRVLLPLLASSNRYADLGLPVHLRKCSLSLSVCPLARTTVRACVRARVPPLPPPLYLPFPRPPPPPPPPLSSSSPPPPPSLWRRTLWPATAAFHQPKFRFVTEFVSIKRWVDEYVPFFFLSRGRRVRVLDFWGGLERDSG